MIERSYMVKPTFQREWVDGGGLFIVLAFFLGGLLRKHCPLQQKAESRDHNSKRRCRVSDIRGNRCA